MQLFRSASGKKCVPIAFASESTSPQVDKSKVRYSIENASVFLCENAQHLSPHVVIKGKPRGGSIISLKLSMLSRASTSSFMLIGLMFAHSIAIGKSLLVRGKVL